MMNAPNNNMKQCKYCKQWIDKRASVCPYCRRKQGGSGCLLAIVLVIGSVIAFFVFFGFLASLAGIDTSSDTSSAPSMSNNDYKATCTSYDYKEIARNPDNFNGTDLIVTGKVIQVSETGSNVVFRVSEQSLDDVWYVTYKYSDYESRILEDDHVTIYGKCEGLKTYTSLLGQNISVPSIKAQIIEISDSTETESEE